MATPVLTPQSVKQYLVSIDGIQAYFQKCTAPKFMKAQTKYNDGQMGIQKTHVDFIEYENVTITKNYDPSKDGTILTTLQRYSDEGTRFDVSIQPVKADQAGTAVPGAQTILLQQCQLVALTYPQVDREGTGLSTIVVELAPDGILPQ